jgi:hypothetical protein
MCTLDPALTPLPVLPGLGIMLSGWSHQLEALNTCSQWMETEGPHTVLTKLSEAKWHFHACNVHLINSLEDAI